MSNLHLTAGPNAPENINVIVEIPKGSQNKYEFDHTTHMLKLDRVLYGSMHYPADYGFIPDTLGEDGDPLDALVLVSFPTYPGTLIVSRPIGVLDMVDSGEPDGKILCVPEKDPRWNAYATIDDVPEALRNEIANFFATYKILEGKEVTVGGWRSADAAKEMILACIERAKK